MSILKFIGEEKIMLREKSLEILLLHKRAGKTTGNIVELSKFTDRNKSGNNNKK